MPADASWGSRRRRLFAVASVLVALSATLTAAQGTARAFGVIKTTDVVNVRVAPNLSGAIVGGQAAHTTPKKIRCAGAGQQIEDTNVWFFIDSDAVSGFGGGWMTAYYTDAVYTTYQDLSDRYGIPRCDRGVASFNGSIYYQPRFEPGDPTVPYTTYTATKDWWAPGACSPDASAYWPMNFDGEGITRASGWSLGRLGITYLMSKYPDRAARLNTIVLFDPGDVSDYTSECDQKYRQDLLMASWLAGNTSRRLLILAGTHTRDAGDPGAGGALYQGVRRYLFSSLRAVDRSRVLVCSYDKMGHPDVLRNFSYLAKSGSVTQCPGTPDSHWNP